MTFTLSENGGRTLITCGGGYSARAAVEEVLSLLSSDGIPNGFYEKKELFSIGTLPLTEGGDIRIMTSNILAQRWLCGGRPSITVRAEVYAAVLAKYSPDVIGVQETDMPWAELFPAYLSILREEYGIDYSWDQNIVDDVANLTSILFKRKRFSIKEHGMRDFSYFTHVKYKLRVLTWAILKDENTGRLCALINTHWSGKKEFRLIEIAEQTALVRDIESRYEGIDVFCTGDYNMHMNGAFEEMKEGSGLTDAKEAAALSGTLINENSGIGIPVYIDHVFFDTDISVVRYETVDFPSAHELSDHLPQYADFKL